MAEIVELTEQPKPKFTLIDLEQKLAQIYSMSQKIQRFPEQVSPEDMSVYVGTIQELFAVASKHVADLEAIDMPTVSNELIQTTINTEKPVLQVCGVQLIENGKLVGTSLYSTVVKARSIRDVLNKKFAELRVNHEAKIVNYPVF